MVHTTMYITTTTSDTITTRRIRRFPDLVVLPTSRPWQDYLLVLLAGLLLLARRLVRMVVVTSVINADHALVRPLRSSSYPPRNRLQARLRGCPHSGRPTTSHCPLKCSGNANVTVEAELSLVHQATLRLPVRTNAW